MFFFLNLLSPIRPLFSFRVRCQYYRHWNIFEIMNAGRFAIMNFFVFFVHYNSDILHCVQCVGRLQLLFLHLRNTT